MRSLTYLLVITVAGAFALSTAAQARGYYHDRGYDRGNSQQRFENRVDRRQARQWDRIREGIHSGDLSRREARRLAKNQQKIARMEDRFERDGYYSPREKRKLERALDRTSRQIKRAKHNDYAPPRGHYRRGWHGRHHRYDLQPYGYEASDESYVYGSSSSTAAPQISPAWMM